MKSLTRRQESVLEYIKEYIDKNHYSPSVRDIADHFQLVSAAGVHKHIKALVRKNYLQKTDHLSRSLRIVSSNNDDKNKIEGTITLPLVGIVAAGKPIQAIENATETISVSTEVISSAKGKFALLVRGDSMIDDGILDGDVVIMNGERQPKNGETVVALINKQETTLKRFFQENGKIRLQPANPTMDPIVIEGGDLEVQGVVVALWRNYNNN